MVKKKRLAPTLIFLLVLVFGGPCVAGAESKETSSPSAPACSEPQHFTSTSVVSDSLAFDSSSGSIGWKMGWNLVDGSWYFSDSLNPVSLHSGWLCTGGTWYWLEPDAGGAMATGLHGCYGSMYWFGPSGAMATVDVH